MEKERCFAPVNTGREDHVFVEWHFKSYSTQLQLCIEAAQWKGTK